MFDILVFVGRFNIFNFCSIIYLYIIVNMFINCFLFINIFIEHIDDYFVYICTDLLIKHLVNMEKIIFDEVHFKQRLNDLRHYLILKTDDSAYDTGYLDAINHVLDMIDND